MIELSSVLWLAVMLSALLGFLRGWREEIQVIVIPIAYIYLLIQFDLFVRAIGFLANIPSNVWFMVHLVGFLSATWYFGYRGHRLVDPRYGRLNSSASWLGALFGALNGWLLMGTFWYLMDIHEYPLTPYITAPSITSPSADTVWALPPVLFTGGISTGNPDVLLVVMLIAILLRFRS